MLKFTVILVLGMFLLGCEGSSRILVLTTADLCKSYCVEKGKFYVDSAYSTVKHELQCQCEEGGK